MIGSLKNIRRTLAATLCLGVSIIVWGCSPTDSPLSNCVPKDTHCEGNVAVECVKNGGGQAGPVEWYELVNTTCAAPSSCFAGDGFAACALSAEPCDYGTFVPTCAGDRVVICDNASKASDQFFQVVEEPCKYGNTCIVGGCAAPGDTKCDPTTHTDACTNGAPTICAQMGNGQSVEYREAFASDACADGNQCLTGPGWVGCGRDGTTCDSGTFQPRCEGDKLITCELTSSSSVSNFVKLEYQTTCPKGCGPNASGVAECTP